MRVHIIAIETGNEPHALRAAAEAWGAEVTVTWVENSDQIVSYFSDRPPHDIIIISGHGDASSLHLPILTPTLQSQYRYTEQITAEQFSEFVILSSSHVINLACEAGSPTLSRAFLACGALSYIGSSIAPDGAASLMYGIELLYGLLVEKLPIVKAHKIASNHDDDRHTFEMFTIEHVPPEGRGEAPRL